MSRMLWEGSELWLSTARKGAGSGRGMSRVNWVRGHMLTEERGRKRKAEEILRLRHLGEKAEIRVT